MKKQVRRLLSFILVLCMISSTIYLNNYSIVSAEENDIVEDTYNEDGNSNENDEELVEQTLSNGVVSITGKLPKNANVETKEMTPEQINKLSLNNKEIVFAYDITLLVDGEEYQPEEKLKVEIKNHKENNLNIFHVETDSQGNNISTRKIDYYKNNLDNVEFETNSFSYYVATLEQNTVDLSKMSITELIDANILLMKWKANKQETTITLNTKSYIITDDNYDSLYKSVYNEMLQKSSTISDINSENINTDTIWNISKNINMNGNINVNNGAKLVILGNGQITRKGPYSINNAGTLCLQGNVTSDGGGETNDARFINSNTVNNNIRVSLYLADEFKIQNFQVKNQDGAGILGNNIDFYMIGGIIGNENIDIKWDDNKITKYGSETEKYLQKRKEEGQYPYLTSINSNLGCFSKDTDTTKLPPKGGGIALIDSNFYMSGGSIVGNGVIGECTDLENNRGSHGGGADFLRTNVNITGGKFSANQSSVIESASNKYQQYSGAIQLEKTESQNYTCSISNTEISYNYSQMWVGAIDVYGGYTLNLNFGSVLKYNCARSNSGTIAVDGTKSNMNMYDGALIQDNHAGGLGAGIRCLGTFTMYGGEIVHNMSVGDAAGLSIQTDSRQGNAILKGGEIRENFSKNNGGGIGIVIGQYGTRSSLSFEGTKVSNNKANKGGGIFTTATHGNIESKFIEGKIENNIAQDGAGIYINQTDTCNTNIQLGEENQNDDKLVIQNNKASNNGGGMFFSHASNSTGSIHATVHSGLIQNNSAENNGGGMYLDSGNLTIKGGNVSYNKSNCNGAGTFIKDGYVHVFGGSFIENYAKKDGGGMYISSNSSPADVKIRGGSLSKNIAGDETSKGNGGAIAVVTDNNNTDTIELGLLEEHKNLNYIERSFTAFNYTDTIDNEEHNHSSCPQVIGNSATGDGGAIYMNSTNSNLNVYCLNEDKNESKSNIAGSSVMSLGGNVNIGDNKHDDENARGNIVVRSSMLVEGGKVVVHGNMDNPYFDKDILVDIKENSGDFHDYRKSLTQSKEYKINYYENFTGNGNKPTGMFIVQQYGENEKIIAESVNFSHPGWKIIGWALNENGQIEYRIGVTISDGNNHDAWTSENKDAPLVLYAIWQRVEYTAKFDANSGNLTYAGKMDDQKFSYGEKQSLTKNAYKIKGKQFVGWKDELGKSYADGSDGSEITTQDGATVILKAQWKDCNHDVSHKFTYTANETDHSIIQSCECGGYDVNVTMTDYKSTIYFDNQEHPISYSVESGKEVIGNKPEITYKKEVNDNSYEAINYIPKDIGKYKASLSLGNATVSVLFEIKSPTEGSNIDAYLKQGQDFSSITDKSDLSIYSDDSFSIHFDAKIVNTNNLYNSAPILSFDNIELPQGTSIIMKKDTKYYYLNIKDNKKEVPVTDFIEMGTNNQFNYQLASNNEDVQIYYFIVDFSKCESPLANGINFQAKLSYKPSNNIDDNIITKSTNTITIKKVESFSIPNSSNELTFNAPSNLNYRWKNKKMYLKLTGENIPSDLLMNVKQNDSNSTIYANKNKEFIIPINEWKTNEKLSLSLSTFQINESKEYNFKASLFSGNDYSIEGNPKVAETNLNLSTVLNEQPKLSFISNNRIISLKDKNLNITFAYDKVKYDLYAIDIERKGDNYKYLSETKLTDSSKIELGAIKESGSYCLNLALKEKNGSTIVLRDKYYFIVKD